MVQLIDIYHVRVYNKSADKVDHYFFSHRQDIVDSIRTTWSKMQDHVQMFISEKDTFPSVVDIATGRVLLTTSKLAAELEQQSTHF